VDLHGKDVFKVLARNYKKWKKMAKNFRLTVREELQHLLRFLPLIPGEKGLLTVYDIHFTPLYMLRL
jgi:hypothetical protein